MKVVKANNFKEGTDGYMLHVNEEELLFVTAMLGWVQGQNPMVKKYSGNWWYSVKKVTGFGELPNPYKESPATNPNWKAPSGNL